MAEMAITAHRMRKSVCPKMVNSFTGLTPRISPPMIAARKQPVPVAESQMNANFAPSGVGLGTTGCIARDLVVDRCIPAAGELGFSIRAVNDVSSGIPGRPVRRCVNVHPVLYWFIAPEKHENRKNQERQPRFERLSKRVGVDFRSGTAGNAGNALPCRCNALCGRPHPQSARSFWASRRAGTLPCKAVRTDQR